MVLRMVELAPDALVERVKAGLEAHGHGIARAGERDRDDVAHAAGAATRMMTWSESAIASSMSCVTKTIVRRSAAPDAEELGLHEEPHLEVERAEGLVHQHGLAGIDQGLRKRRALAHAARELVRQMVLEPGEADEVDGPGDAVARGLVGAAAAQPVEPAPGEIERQADILLDRSPGKQRVVLGQVAGADRRPETGSPSQ